MPRGPNGEKRPGDVVGCAVTVAKIATGEIEEELPSARRNGGLRLKGNRKLAIETLLLSAADLGDTDDGDEGN